MKNKTLLMASICWGVVLAMVPAFAQDARVQVKVPFEFSVSGKTFPAGDYRIVTEQHQVRIQDDRGWTVATALANSTTNGTIREDAAVTFHCYDKRCFLSEVWSSEQDNGLEVNTSRAEAALVKELAGGASQY